VVAERSPHQLRRGQLVDCLAEGLRQGHDPPLLPLLGGEVVEVAVHRRLELIALLDPLEPRVQERGEGEVGVAGRIGAADLGARRLLGARLVQRDPDQGRAVAL
jgi:hypothetical protein